jgi:hypothetical protein
MALVDSFLAPFVLIFILGIGAFIKNGDYSNSLYIIGTCIIICMCILQFIVKDPKESTKEVFNSGGFSS